MEFLAILNPEESEDYINARKTLRESGRLEYPWAEKVGGESNLFAIRIRKGGNARFFYAYDDGTAVWILTATRRKLNEYRSVN